MSSVDYSSPLFTDSNITHVTLGSGGNLNSFAANNSGPREVMRDASHLGQSLTLVNPTSRRVLSGTEDEHGKFTTSLTMPANGIIIAKIDKFIPRMGDVSNRINPTTIIFYDNQETGEVDVMEVPLFHANHDRYCYMYQRRRLDLRPGDVVRKDDIIASSPSLKEDGEYRMGTELNVVFASHPAGCEDGILISASAAEKKLRTNIRTTRTVDIHPGKIPLNTYGTLDNYKIMPETGDVIDERGKLCAFRSNCDIYGFLTLTKVALLNELAGDEEWPVEPGNRLVDTHCIMGRLNRQWDSTVFYQQASSLAERCGDFANRLLKQEADIYRNRPNAKFSKAATNLLCFKNAEDYGLEKRKAVSFTNRRAPIKDFRIDFELVKEMPFRIGMKITDLHGGKAVGVKVIPDSEMFRDKFGTVADICIDPATRLNRMNPGGLYEQAFNAYSDQVQRKIQDMGTDEAWDFVNQYFSMISPIQHMAVNEAYDTPSARSRYIKQIKREPIEMCIPPNNAIKAKDAIKSLEAHPDFKLDYGQLTYTDLAGNTVTTADDIIIASMYFVWLDKMGEYWQASSVSKQHHFGLPAKLSKIDKNTSRMRNQQARWIDESTGRLIQALCGGEALSDTLMLANSPRRVNHMLDQFISSPDPMNIEDIRPEKINLKDNQAAAYVQHMLYTYGVKFNGGYEWHI